MKKVNPVNLINWWLNKYHNTNLDQVNLDNPSWLINPEEHTREFYNKYRVTQKEHDEWEVWAKSYTKKITKLSKKMIDQSWWSIYLNTSPFVIKKQDEKS